MTSIISTNNRSSAHDLLVCGDTDGYIRLFRYLINNIHPLHSELIKICFNRYPCISPKAEYNEEKVYSGTIACARFLFNDRNIVTVGGTDAGLMLWELVED